MAKGVRPADIAKRLGVSTSALRHYEERGIIPPVKRGANGYRQYTDEHIAYFECIRAMGPGFGMDVIHEVLQRMVAGEIDEALWRANAAQASLHRRKAMAEKTIQVLDSAELDPIDARGRRRRMTIGEVSRETSIAASAIRHWEMEGLIRVERDPDNGYRTFGPAQVRQILIIGTLRSAIWSLDTIREVIRELDHNNLEQARRIARESLRFLSDLNRHQMRGIRYLYRLVELGEDGANRWGEGAPAEC